MLDMGQAIGSIMPIIKILFMGVIGIGLSAGFGYYFFVIKRRRIWNVRIYEAKSDGKFALVAYDKLIRYRFDKGKKTIFMFKNNKGVAIPPPDAGVERLGNKEFCEYLRLSNDEFVPLIKGFNQEQKLYSIINNKDKKDKLFKVLIEKLNWIYNAPSSKIDEKYIYAPISKHSININYTQPDYDVDMMRIQGIELRDNFYKLKTSIWEKYGTLITIGAVIVLIIITMVMSYDYAQNVLTQSFGTVNELKPGLERLANAIATGSSGSVPPS